MKLRNYLIAIGMAILSASSYAQFNSGSNYNTANMSYQANSTISQNVVFDSAMQAGGTFDFSVNAHGGGGRPLQHDTGNLKLEFYNSSGGLVTSAQTSYSSNLLQMNAWSSGPGDNSEPWITISLSYNLSSADAANVAYVKVTMIGTDSSWWAGNYGPQWQMPTLTFNGGSTNILYNPEFGVAPGNVQAQGWTSSTGYSGVCGVTSGSATCVTNATGVTANMSGGGYDANGGTTSGTAGGYSSTLTSTTIIATVNNGGVDPGTSGGGGSSGPVAVNNASGSTASNTSGTTTLDVTNAGTYTNDGTNGNVTNTGTFTNNGTTGTVDNSGTFTNSSGATTGNVTNSGTFTNSGTTGTVSNSGTFTNNVGGVTGAVTNNSYGTFDNYGTVTTVTNDGTFNNKSTGVTGVVTNNNTFNNDGTTGDVTNNGGFANNGTTGTVTNNGLFVNGVTGATGTVTNNLGGTFTNSGTVTTITNLGTFTNSGTGGAWTNGFNGDGNTATFNNTGTLGNGTNYSTFTNTGGTIGTVSNVGTFNNAGTTGAVTNTGVFNNNAGGTVSELAYNNHVVNNAGTITLITYNGGTVDNTGTIGSINNTEAHGTFHNTGTVTGTVTTNSTFNNNVGGVVTGLYTNNGTLTNAGTIGDWINNSVINNSGTMANGTNTGTYTNTGTVGTVANTGTMTTSGTTGLITNTGTLNVTGGTTSVNNTGTLNVSGGTLGTYTQSAPGVTTMSINQPILVTGLASLGGGITINDVPAGYGRYTVLSAGSISGTYDASNGASNYLRYSLTDVKLYITPDATATQTNIDATAKNVSNMTSLQGSVVTGALGNDCAVFGKDNACVSLNAGGSKAGTGDLYTNGLTVGKKLTDNWRFGVSTNSFANNPNIGGVTMNSNPAVGGFVTYSKDRLSVTASAATNQGTMTVTRTGPETGVGTSSVNNTAYQVKGSYGIPVTETVTVTPYVGIRHSETRLGGYTETGAIFPLTVDATNRVRTDVLAGISITKQFTEKLTGSVSVGVTQKLNDNPTVYKGTSEIGGLSTFNGAVLGGGSTNASLGAGVSYAVDKSTRVGVNVGVQQKGDNPNINSVGISITKGF